MSSFELPDRCVPCVKGTPPLDLQSAIQRHRLVPEWQLVFPRLRRTFTLRDFRAALAWTNRVGMLAEEQQHHPDFHLTGWNQLELVLWTHAADGLHDNDFVLAHKIDALWTRTPH